MNLDVSTKRVVEMYSKYPFPSQGNHGNYFERVVLPCVRSLSKEYPIKRFLEAGCGTGNITADIGSLLPNIEITAVDITEESLNRAKERLAERGLKNVTVRRSNLMEFDPALGIFDFVYSQGVIHHLSDPVTGMRNLNRYLKNGHHAFVWLYSLLGRRDLLDMREALKVLGVESLPWEERIRLAKETKPLFFSGRPTVLRKAIKVLDYIDKYGFKGLGHYLSDYFRRSSTEGYDSIIVADQILHPQDRFYRFHEAVEMFNEAGFEFVSVLEGMSDSVEQSFGPSAKVAHERLSLTDKYRLIELHEKPLGVGYLIQKKREL
jgi:SAM-dependent methyltransferase